MIYFSADDYGIGEKSNSRIEECVKSGALNKISVMPNGEIPDLISRFENYNVALELHTNLVEGVPLSNPQEVSLLINKNGCFKYSFLGLLLLSLSPKKKAFKRQIYLELQNQIRFWKKTIGDDGKFLIDSHQHTHMIPLIFETLLEVIKDEGIEVNYLRFPSEPIGLYLSTPSLYGSYSISGIIKQWILAFFGLINRKKLKESNIPSALFMGVLFSGSVTKRKVDKILPKYLKLAEKRNQNIEILFHPGYLEWGDRLSMPTQKGFYRFYYSNSRKKEFDALMELNNNK